VVPDPAANALLIAANKTRYEEVLELIRQLDRRQDQVLIETALIELTGTDFRDIGIELAFADTTGDGGFAATNFGLSDLQDLQGNDGVPDTRVPIIGDGITAGILSGNDVNLPFIIAAAQRKDGANVLNVPSVLVNNNGSARVVTLDEQPTTTITATGGGAAGTQTQENFRQFEEAGITLEISPSISAARYLRLDISLVVSTFTGSFSANSAIPPPRITREIATTVNVPDGDTMVIGGIITDNLTETSRRTPWISDIPLLGMLFRRDSHTNNRTTLSSSSRRTSCTTATSRIWRRSRTSRSSTRRRSSGRTAFASSTQVSACRKTPLTTRASRSRSIAAPPGARSRAAPSE